jgi:hypothetical protein
MANKKDGSRRGSDDLKLTSGMVYDLVACPKPACDQGKGYPCVTKNGNVAASAHEPRFRLADEILRKQRAGSIEEAAQPFGDKHQGETSHHPLPLILPPGTPSKVLDDVAVFQHTVRFGINAKMMADRIAGKSMEELSERAAKIQVVKGGLWIIHTTSGLEFLIDKVATAIVDKEDWLKEFQ